MKVTEQPIKSILLRAARITGAFSLLLLVFKGIDRMFEKAVGLPMLDRPFDESLFPFHSLMTLPLVFVISSVQIYWQDKHHNSPKPKP